MLNVGTGEILVLLLVAMVVLGPDKLPGAARSAGRALHQLRRLGADAQLELHRSLDDLTSVDSGAGENGGTPPSHTADADAI